MIGKRKPITYYQAGIKNDLKPDDTSYHGKKTQHKRTGVIRIIYVLVGNETPGGEALVGKYKPPYHILYDTFVLNNQFYNLLD